MCKECEKAVTREREVMREIREQESMTGQEIPREKEMTREQQEAWIKQKASNVEAILRAMMVAQVQAIGREAVRQAECVMNEQEVLNEAGAARERVMSKEEAHVVIAAWKVSGLGEVQWFEGKEVIRVEEGAGEELRRGVEGLFAVEKEKADKEVEGEQTK